MFRIVSCVLKSHVLCFGFYLPQACAMQRAASANPCADVRDSLRALAPRCVLSARTWCACLHDIEVVPEAARAALLGCRMPEDWAADVREETLGDFLARQCDAGAAGPRGLREKA